MVYAAAGRYASDGKYEKFSLFGKNHRILRKGLGLFPLTLIF